MNTTRLKIIASASITCAAVGAGMWTGFSSPPVGAEIATLNTVGTNVDNAVKNVNVSPLVASSEPGEALDGQALKTVLVNAGFSGENLRIAWAIAMRESNGIPDIVSAPNPDGTHDYGLFQINDIQRSVYNFSEVLTAEGNARIAYKLSDGGRDFSSWGVGETGWAGQLKRTYPKSWQELNMRLQEWVSRFPE